MTMQWRLRFMNIVKRLFSYPILKDENDAYESCLFKVELEDSAINLNNLDLSFSMEMDCPEIEQLIQDGKAEYAVHLECSSTAYRTLLTSSVKQINHSVSINRLNGEVQMLGLIIVKEPIKEFFCTDWNDDYQGLTFDFVKGNILAYQNLDTLLIRKNMEEFKDTSSIFSVCKRASSDEKPMELELNNETIRIDMNEKDYKVYASYSGRGLYQQIINSMLILPALVYVFEELRQKDGIHKYENRSWYLSLVSAYAERNIDFAKMLQDDSKTSYCLAQEAMELPITKAFSLLPLIDRQDFNGEEEE